MVVGRISGSRAVTCHEADVRWIWVSRLFRIAKTSLPARRRYWSSRSNTTATMSVMDSTTKATWSTIADFSIVAIDQGIGRVIVRVVSGDLARLGEFELRNPSNSLNDFVI